MFFFIYFILEALINSYLLRFLDFTIYHFFYTNKHINGCGRPGCAYLLSYVFYC
nr:MAG TPA_asm: hypothetical protein [Caudoviricetes sp.]